MLLAGSTRKLAIKQREKGNNYVSQANNPPKKAEKSLEEQN